MAGVKRGRSNLGVQERAEVDEGERKGTPARRPLFSPFSMLRF